MAVRASSKQIFLFRSRLLLFISFLLLSLLLIRLYDLQIVKHNYYSMRADRQYSYKSEYYDRESIYFTRKDGTLFSVANVKRAHILALVPKQVKDSEVDKIYKFLKSLGIDYPYRKFKIKAGKKDDPYEEIKRKVPEDLAKKIKEQNFSGVILPIHRYRFYPGASLAAHVIGFVAQKDSDPNYHGRYGLEKYYDDVLYKDPERLGVNFFAELFSNAKEIMQKKSPGNGSIISSLEPLVQAELEKVLKETFDKWKSKRVSAIVYNPQNGEIVAMASYPNFDLNNFSKVESPKIYENPLVENVYEMGSIVKAITVAAGLDSGAIYEKEKYNDTGCKIYDKARICNYDHRARGTVPVQEILSQSLNVGAAWVYEKMGKEKFKSYFDALGLTDISAIDLPNEAEPLVQNLNSPRDIEFATASFGQGVAFTPVQMVRALGALGTGFIQKPHIVKSIRKDSGITLSVAPEISKKRVLSEKTTETISRMLVEVVDKKLAGGKKKKEHYTVAVKTGTAELSAGGKHYLKDVYNHTFFAYFPAFNPRFVILFINEQPKGAKYASETLSDPSFEMVDFLINYYNIEPDR